MEKINKTHPVIRHLLARKHKKVPIDDGRKIVLVLYGGGMASILGAGIMIAFNELGLDCAFDEIYACSGGFCNASYLLSGNPQEGTSMYYEELSGRNFIDLRKIWNMENVDWVIKCTKKNKPLHVENILAHRTKLFVQVRNITKKEIEFHEVHNYSPAHYFTLLKAAIKIPFLSPGGVRLGKAKFKDALPLGYFIPSKDVRDKIFKKALDSNATDILVAYNMPKQYKYVHKYFDKKIFGDGGILEVFPGSAWKLNYVETDPETLKKACINMGTMIKKIFGDPGAISLKYTPTKIG